MCNLISHIKERRQTENIWEQGADENAWDKERSNERSDKIAY
jgi:hypothetical protein